MEKGADQKNAIIILTGIFMTFVSLSSCSAAAGYTLSDDINAGVEYSLDNGEQGTAGIMHSIDSVPEEVRFTDKWFGISDGKLVCVDLETKETFIVWEFLQDGYNDIQFVHNENDIYAIGKIDSIQNESFSIWKINMKHFDREKIVTEQYGYASLMLCTDQMLYAWYGNPEQTKYVSYKIDEEGRLEKFHEEDGKQGQQQWMLHPFYMDDVYGYRLYVEQEGEERKIVVLDTESGNQEYLTEASVSLHGYDYETIPGNTYIAVAEYSNSLLDTMEVISLKEGSIKPLPIKINGKPYQMMDEWLYGSMSILWTQKVERLC